jgi:DNA replication and repair protein RecF
VRILSLSTTHFRNLEHEPIQFSEGINVFVGKNGQGKTNLLESIHLFKFGRSFRTTKDTELIRFGKEFCRVEVEIRGDTEGTDVLALSVVADGTKRIKIGGREIPRLSELVGRYPCILFGPQDLMLTSGYPQERRRLIDMTGSMTDRPYMDTLRGYRRVLSQRNAALKRRDSRTVLGVWDDELVKKGGELVRGRLRVVEELHRHIGPHVDALSAPFALDISYESDLLRGCKNPDGLEDHFAGRLEESRGEEHH